MRRYQLMFALGLGLLAAATVGAIAPQEPQCAVIAFIGAALVGISLPLLIEAVRKGP